MMGKEQSFTMSLNEPGIGISNIDNTVKAGEYFGIGVDTGRIGETWLAALNTKLQATKTNLEAQNYSTITKDDLVGDLLHTTIASYFDSLDVSDEISAKTIGIIRYRATSVGMFSVKLNSKTLFGVPVNTNASGLMMDVDRIMQAVFGKDGSMGKVKQYMLMSGNMSSSLENIVPEKTYTTMDKTVQGISTVRALQIANSQGIPICTIDQNNIDTMLPQLQVGADVKIDISNAVNAGKQVVVSKSDITFSDWTGCGYVVIDPSTGAGAYMISGNSNGGWLFVVIGMLLLLIGIMTSEIGVGLVLLMLGILYIGFGLCIINNNDAYFQYSLMIAPILVGGILGYGAAAGEELTATIVGGLLSLVFGAAGYHAGEMIHTSCEGSGS